MLLSAPWSLLCRCAQELQLRVPCRGGAVLPKLAGEGGQCPSAPGCPTLHDWLGFCGALMGFAVLGFQWTQQFPVTTLIPWTAMGSHFILLLSFSSRAPSLLSLASEKQVPGPLGRAKGQGGAAAIMGKEHCGRGTVPSESRSPHMATGCLGLRAVPTDCGLTGPSLGPPSALLSHFGKQEEGSVNQVSPSFPGAALDAFLDSVPGVSTHNSDEAPAGLLATPETTCAFWGSTVRS